jgi:RHH-type transcriptional regulator, rel operon repressor / antitoxin RelB
MKRARSSRPTTTTLTVRVDRRTRDRLQKLARATARSRSFLAAEAIRAFVDRNEWQIEAIKQGIADADAGRVVDHERVEAWLESWGSPDESEPPR